MESRLQISSEFGHRAKSLLCSVAPSLLYTSNSPSIHVTLLLISYCQVQKELSLLMHHGFRKPCGYWAKLSALVFTTPELFLFIIGINEYWIKHGVVVCLTSNVLAQCPLCLSHTLSSYLWKKTKDWHFFFPINTGSEMGCDSSLSESQESFHGHQSNVIMTVG